MREKEEVKLKLRLLNYAFSFRLVGEPGGFEVGIRLNSLFLQSNDNEMAHFLTVLPEYQENGLL